MCFLIIQFVSFFGSYTHTHTSKYISISISIFLFVYNQMLTYVHFQTLTHKHAYAYTHHVEYGRSCKDIGCRPSETCVISHDSCSWNQQDGKECGSYPTCKRSTNTNTSPGKKLTCSLLYSPFKYCCACKIWLSNCVCFVYIVWTTIRIFTWLLAGRCERRGGGQIQIHFIYTQFKHEITQLHPMLIIAFQVEKEARKMNKLNLTLNTWHCIH